MTTIETQRRGRPANVWRKVELLIGTAGAAALKDSDLFVIPGSLARELALIVGDPIQPITTAAATIPDSASLQPGTDNAH